ncbi:hypothetical protein HanHA300_Chr02g0054301 [Helianthus annuus]|nr:hypothetical protein HanHA300_Chr02g0054301 [Helianthus annuus]
MILKSECSKFKDELKQLNEIKLRSQFMEKTQDQRVNGLFLVEGRIRELQKKILIGFRESDLSFINSDLEMLLGIVQNLEKGTGTGLTRVVDLGESQSLELLCQLNEAKAERGNLIKKMNEMECYYESLVQELEENRDRLLVEFQKLRYEHLSCINTISTCKSETETIRLCMKDQILKFDKERLALSCVNEELEKRVMVVEAYVQELEEDRERIVKEFESLKNEHSTCDDTISSCKYDTELIRHELKHQTLKLTKEKQELEYVKRELEKRVSTAESLVQEVQKNREQVLGELRCLKNEHSTCADTILSLKAEIESIRRDMEDQALKFAKEKHDFGCVNEQLDKRVTTAEALVQELEKNREEILDELKSLQYEHSTCGDTILTHNNMNNRILRLEKERHDLGCVNEELKKHVVTTEALVQELEEKQERILGEFQSLQTEHSTCGNTTLAHKSMNDQILRLEKERNDLCCVNKELKKRVVTTEALIQELEEKQEHILGEFQSLQMEHSTCGDTISAHKNMNDQILRLEKERNDLVCVNEELKKRVMTSEALIQELEEKQEQCETTVQELKQQLFVSKRHGDDILIKLQDALDEIESRKKCEASYLKRIDELSFKIGGLEGELQSIQAELDCALLNLECCREEKEKIIAQITEFEKTKNERSILAMMSCGSSFQDLQRELMQLHKANEELECMYPRFKNFTGDGNALGRVLALEIELAGALMVKKKSTIQFQSSFLKQHSDEEAIFRSFRDINELIKDTLEIKSKYVNVETELNEMHERYTQLSLQLAEVEGERQKLMMSVKYAR